MKTFITAFVVLILVLSIAFFTAFPLTWGAILAVKIAKWVGVF